MPLRYSLRSPGTNYTLSFLFEPPEIGFLEYKVGRPSQVRCDDPAGYLPWRRVPLNLAKAEGPYRVCAVGQDEAGNPTPPLDILLDGTQILPNGVVNAASYAPGAVAPGEWVSVFGVDFPQQVAVHVTDSGGVRRPASLCFASPDQINLLISPETALGPATLTVNGASARVAVEAVAPGLFAAGYLLRVRADGSRSYEPAFAGPLEVGPDSEALYLELYGTGIRGGRQVTARVGRQPVEVLYAGPIAGEEGVDQVNLRLPRPFLLRGYQTLTLTVDGKVANRLTLWFR